VPELPDVIIYIEALSDRLTGHRVQDIRLLSPFVLRSVDPPIADARGALVKGLRRIGKRIVLVLDPPSGSGSADLFLVIHLMIAGRLRWRTPGQKLGVGPKIVLATLEFEHGTLFFTEASSKKRASLRLVRGEEALGALDPGGLEPLGASFEEFRQGLTRENHTLKRALTDPQLFSGIGNAYSDEILHGARLSPLKLSQSLSDEEMHRLFEATQSTLGLGRSPAQGSRLRLPREGHRLSRRHGRPWPFPPALSRVRITRAANRAGRARVQLLRDVSNRRSPPG
jgi:formamidopyrimidine-DNA glycosylase